MESHACEICAKLSAMAGTPNAFMKIEIQLEFITQTVECHQHNSLSYEFCSVLGEMQHMLLFPCFTNHSYFDMVQNYGALKLADKSVGSKEWSIVVGNRSSAILTVLFGFLSGTCCQTLLLQDLDNPRLFHLVCLAYKSLCHQSPPLCRFHALFQYSWPMHIAQHHVQ